MVYKGERPEVGVRSAGDDLRRLLSTGVLPSSIGTRTGVVRFHLDELCWSNL